MCRRAQGLYAEHWILSPNYVYPNARNGIQTEIVPDTNPPYRCDADCFERARFGPGYPLRPRHFQRQRSLASALVQRRSSLLPTSAERLIKVHDGQQFLEPDLRQVQLPLEQIAIGVQRVKLRVHASAVTHIGQSQPVL